MRSCFRRSKFGPAKRRVLGPQNGTYLGPPNGPHFGTHSGPYSGPPNRLYAPERGVRPGVQIWAISGCQNRPFLDPILGLQMGVQKWTHFEHFCSGPDQDPIRFWRPRSPILTKWVILHAYALRHQKRGMSVFRGLGPQNGHSGEMAKRAQKGHKSAKLGVQIRGSKQAQGAKYGLRNRSPKGDGQTQDLGPRGPPDRIRARTPKWSNPGCVTKCASNSSHPRNVPFGV